MQLIKRLLHELEKDFQKGTAAACRLVTYA
jgi:hypothetical protein